MSSATEERSTRKAPKPLRADADASPRHMPFDVLQSHVLPLIKDATTLKSFALTCTEAYRIVASLPDWYCLTLENGLQLCAFPLPIIRAMSILSTHRCELCGSKVDPLPPNRTHSPVFAHEVCIKQHLVASRDLPTRSAERMQWVQAPKFNSVGARLESSIMDPCWWRDNNYVPHFWTVDGSM